MLRTEFDVVVIGSGAGGAPIAYELAKAGKSVLVLEKGPLFRPQYQTPDGLSDFKRDELIADGPEKTITHNVFNKGESFYTSHVEPDLNDEPHVYRGKDEKDRITIEGYTAQVVGGGTQLYGGVSLRFTETDFKLATFNENRQIKEDPKEDVKREARDWPVSYNDLLKYYEKAESLIGINGTSAEQKKPWDNDCYQPPLATNPISEYAYAGMLQLAQSLGQTTKPYRTPLAVITRDHPPSGRKVPTTPENAKTSYVNRFGCPLGLKSNTWVSLLSQVEKKDNFELRANCVVTHLETKDGIISKVNYRDPSGRQRSVSGKIVVVACSAIEVCPSAPAFGST